MSDEASIRLKSVLIAGALIALFSVTPFVNLGNCCCGLWMVVGGALAVYLYARSMPPGETLTRKKGGVLGLLAGLYGALFGVLLKTALLAFFDFDPAREAIRTLISAEEASGPLAEALGELEGSEPLGFGSVTRELIASLVITGLFAAVGGKIGVVLLERRRKRSDGT